MSRKTLVMGLALALASGTAMAMHCPKDMKEIDAALSKGADLSAAELDEVKQLRARGEELHEAGKHQESVDTLARAKKILGI